MSTEQTPTVIELNFSSTDEASEDKLGDQSVIWKDILREGRVAITPGRKKKEPFTVIAKGESDPARNIVSMTDICAAFEDKAFQDVTIPDGHPKPGDSALNNTGYARALRIVKKKGKHFLQAALGFTEPDAAGKVKRGTVPNVSSGLFLGFTRKADGKYFPCALNHVALTKTPWLDELDSFKKVYAADDDIGDVEHIYAAEFAEGEAEETDKADIVWNEKDGVNWLREALSRAITPDPPSDPNAPYVARPDYFVQDVSQSKGLGLVTEYYKGDSTRWVVPFTVEDNEVKAAPNHRWVEGKEALIAASDDDTTTINFEDLSTEKVVEQLSIALSDMFGDVGSSYEVEQVSLDNRARILNKSDNKMYVAEFGLGAHNKVLLAPPSQWEAISLSQDNEADGTRPASAPKPTPEESKVVMLHDPSTPEGRVQAARQRRRASMASRTL